MKKNLSYMDSVHRDGRIWGIVVAIALLSFPLLLSLIFGVAPDFEVLLKGIFATAPMYWAVGIVEIFTYVTEKGTHQRNVMKLRLSLGGSGTLRDSPKECTSFGALALRDGERSFPENIPLSPAAAGALPKGEPFPETLGSNSALLPAP